MKETQLSRAIRNALIKSGVWVIRIQSGIIPAIYGNVRRFIHCAEPGTPDIWTPLGFIEVKTDTGKLSPVQVAWHAKAAANGVRVTVVRSVKQALETIREWKKQDGRREANGNGTVSTETGSSGHAARETVEPKAVRATRRRAA